ncbi:hypothetical protein L228DRAFT_16810 [Xylona heveae TC161]|uniref:Deacetylase-like protein n=1 Tax=Xylona heveae (strain CBS 132557 / TC161) TaxID=1328760 RepID=A0A165JVJ5_XYLHT|nr:hypothetical protein L228DRAFT_16810 [Xylona heveae TC161]KZF26684.1 hypothetical protein L228DRAFT_16810 [Xylona heveae TC161]
MNRAQRRAAARDDTNASSTTSSSSSIPLVHPERRTPEGKTLLQLAEERQALLNQGTPFPKNGDSAAGSTANALSSEGNKDNEQVKISELDIQKAFGGTGSKGEQSKRRSTGQGKQLDEPIGRFGQAVFFAITMTMVHFTLDVLIHQQYRQDIVWPEIWERTLTAAPGE